MYKSNRYRQFAIFYIKEQKTNLKDMEWFKNNLEQIIDPPNKKLITNHFILDKFKFKSL